jgi:radical SAM protein with 4Fe4S-binding SPASM domain
MTQNKIIPIAIENSTVCAVPWMHLAFEPSGKVIPCCLTSNYNYFVGDLNTESIEEIWNSDNMKSLRKSMINGEEPTICSKCFDREKITGESSRTYHTRDFPEVVKKVSEITLEDGTCTEMNLKYWDFRFSNLCNFKCRTCGPRYSSGWVPDAKKLGYADQEKVWSIDVVDDKTNFDFLKDQINVVERIYFAGGEPLMMPEHWQILDMLVENNRFDVKLSYNTNASVLTYQKKNIIDYWKKWKFGKLEVWPSIDEIGKRAELIRAGTVWHKVEANLKELASLENAIIRPGLTIGAMNVFRLPEIVKHLVSIGVIKEKLQYKNFFINLLVSPDHYHVSILSDEFRQEITKKIKLFIEEHNNQYDTDISQLFTHILHELNLPYNKKAAINFMNVSAKVDAVRNENIFEVIPELEDVRNNLKSLDDE